VREEKSAKALHPRIFEEERVIPVSLFPVEHVMNTTQEEAPKPLLTLNINKRLFLV
jgi:hypothetical protein